MYVFASLEVRWMQKRMSIIKELETVNFLLETGAIDREEAFVMRNHLESAV